MSGRKSLRNTILFGPLLQLMVVAAASMPPPIPAQWFYMIFLAVLGLHVYFYERDNPGERVLDTRQYSLLHAPAQAGAGALVGLGLTVPFILFGRFSPGLASWQDFALQALFVAFVETVYLVIFVETVKIGDFPLGTILWPFVFGFLHVRSDILTGTISATTGLRFLWSFLFGILFWFLYAARKMDLGKWQRYFGAVTSQVCHLIVNLIILLFPLTLWGFDLFPM